MSNTDLPAPQAIGWVTGQIVEYDGDRHGQMLLADGSKVPCLLSGHPNFIKELVTATTPQSVKVYPGASKSKLYFKVVGPARTRKMLGCFFVRGRIKRNETGQIMVLVWSERLQKGFPVIVSGFLRAEINEYWSLEAAVEDSELVLVDGEKLADAWYREERDCQEALRGVFVSSGG